MAVCFSRAELMGVYQRLLDAFGDPGWWPAGSRFEVLVGAVLTQNTAWSNVERALAGLQAALAGKAMDAAAILDLDEASLAQAIRSSGYFNQKAKRLRTLSHWFVEAGGFEALDRWPTEDLRRALLDLNGIGPETADDMVLYAFERPVFVVDTYTRRALARWLAGKGLPLSGEALDWPYERLRSALEAALPQDVELYQRFHGLIVLQAKASCGKRPRCEGCVLRGICGLGQDVPPAADITAGSRLDD